MGTKPRLTGEARVGKRIAKQTGASLKLKEAHEDKRITPKAIATKAGHTTLEPGAGPTQKVKG